MALIITLNTNNIFFNNQPPSWTLRVTPLHSYYPR